MAILQAYSVHDKAVGAFMRPFYCVSRGEALRVFMDAVGDRKSPFCQHPGDYVLYQCGEFDDAKGVFTQEEPEKVISALECVRKADVEAGNLE